MSSSFGTENDRRLSVRSQMPNDRGRRDSLRHKRREEKKKSISSKG